MTGVDDQASAAPSDVVLAPLGLVIGGWMVDRASRRAE